MPMALNEGTDVLIAQIDPRTIDSDLATFERETRQPIQGVREVVQEIPRHMPQPTEAWPEYYSPSPRQDGLRQEPDLQLPHGSPGDNYALPDTMGADDMIHTHYGQPPAKDAQSFAELFHSISANKGASVRFASDPRPTPQAIPVDSSYHEREELLAKIDDLRILGFGVPQMQDLRSMTVEDLRSVVRRRTMSNDTHTLVNSVCSVICGFAKWLELGNSLCGGVLPLQGYAAEVVAATKTQRFRLAIYQVIHKLGGRITAGPWMEIAIVLLFPIVQAVVSKAVVYFSRGRIPLSAQGVYNNMSAATAELTEAVRRNPNDGGGVIDDPMPEEEEESEYEEEEEEEMEEEAGGDSGGLGGRPITPHSRPPLRRPDGYIVAA